jgi:hypothetical protein
MPPTTTTRAVLIGLGLLLTATGLLPLATWLLDPGRSGVPGAATAGLVVALWPSVVGGTAVVLLASWLGSRLVLPPAALATLRARVEKTPTPRRLRWTLGCAALAFVGAMAAHHLVLRGHPTLLDEMVQLADARAFPGALELPVDPAFRVLQHGRVTGPEAGAEVEGWVSMYPPGHTLVLQAKLAFGHLPIALLWGGAVAAAVALFFLLLPAWVAAGAGVLLALSPFGWLVGGSALSHVTAAFGVSVALLAAVSSACVYRGVARIGWAALVGAAAGVAVTARPLTGLALAVVLPAGIWLALAARGAKGDGARGFMVRAFAATAAGLPFLYFMARVQSARFADPLLTGYEATFGPAVRPGFRVDAWGNAYDLPTALGTSSADLFLMGIAALETPMPLGAAIGLGLLALAAGIGSESADHEAAPAVGTGHREAARHRPLRDLGGLFLFGGWIVVAVLANGTYWHHGFHFGPRMMFETLPAWIGLGAWVVWRLSARGAAVRGAVAGACVAMLLGAAAFGIPTRLSTARVGDELAAQLEISPPPDDAGLVFLHGSSARRAVAKLQGLGMRADSIEAAIRRNDLCDVTRWANAHREGREREAPALDFRRRPGSPDDIAQIETGPGVNSRFRTGAGGRVEVDPECLADVVRPDAAGTLELDPLLWRLEAPGFAGDHVLWVRDLGPEDNRALITANPDRRAYVVTPDADGRAVYEPYAEGMSRIWGRTPD